MTMVVFALSYHAATFGRVHAAQFKKNLLPVEVVNNIVLINEVKERKQKLDKVDLILKDETSFMIIGGFNHKDNSYFFFTEPYNGLHRLDAYIIHDDDELSTLKSWHRENYADYILQLF